MTDFFSKLVEISNLAAGWDGYNGKPVTDKAIATAQNLTPVPLGNGGLQIELHAGGADVEIEIDPGGNVISVMWSRRLVLTSAETKGKDQ